MIRILRSILVSLLLSPLFLAPAVAYDLPAINLGFTSFLDGGPPAGPGHYLSEYVHFYSADSLKGNVPPGADVDVQVLMNQFIYQSDQPILFGGKWGLNLMLPVVDFDADVLPENKVGFGDLLIGPYIQWDPIMGAKGPLFMHRIELQTILPTGRYDEGYALNPGSNHYSFNPYWSATAFLGPHATVSWRLHYLYNGTNDDPFIGTPLGKALDKVKPGQAWHVNFAAEYEVWPKHLRLGVNGYYLDQFTESEYNGQKGSNTEEKVLGIGPGLVWHFSRDAHLFANAYFESQAENRPEGDRYNVRFVYHF